MWRTPCGSEGRTGVGATSFQCREQNRIASVATMASS